MVKESDEINLKVGREAVDAAKKGINTNNSKEFNEDLQFIDSYVLKMNFENKLPLTEKGDRQAELNLQMQRDTNDKKRAAIEFKVKLTAKNSKNEECFVLELSYVGIFVINQDQGDAQKLLSTDGASKLYPYLQHAIADIARMTHTKMSLGPMNFYTSYKEQV